MSSPSLPSWSPHPLVVKVAAHAACVVVIGAAVWLVMIVLGQLALVLFPIGVTVFATRVLDGPCSWLRRRGWRPAPAAAVTFVGAALVVAGVLALIVPPMVDEFSDLGDTLDEGLGEVEDWVVDDSPFDVTREDIADFEDDVVERGRAAVEDSQEQVTRGARLVVSAIAGLLLAAILTFFALKDGPRFVDWVDGQVGSERREEVRAVARAAWAALGGYLRGAALLGLVEAVVIGVAMALVGAGLVVPVMILTFAAAFVPIVGATAAGVIAVLVTLAAGGVVPALIIAVVAVAVQQLDNDLLAPWIYGKSLELHPVAVLLSITTGTALFGFTGTVLAVPLTATVVTSYLAVQRHRRAGADTDDEPDADHDSDDGAVARPAPSG